MQSLNEIYKNNELYYWCNTCGDINVPGEHPLHCGKISDMPLKERNLYENYWYEGAGCCMYVVDYKNEPAMALGFLFDESYLCDILKKAEVTKEDMSVFYHAVVDYAKMLRNEIKISFCEILVGEDTDPDGHELLVIVPYERRSQINEIATYLDEVVYHAVENLL